jgi:hypothetical protein
MTLRPPILKPLPPLTSRFRLTLGLTVYTNEESAFDLEE